MWKILKGDVRDRLKDIEDKSVQCVITSPPYFGLRDYGTANWDGGDPECDHKDEVAIAERRRQRKSMIAVGEMHDGSTRTRVHDEQIGQTVQHKGSCPKCGAKRIDSQIGLETSPELYIQNMVEVFREIKRVLRDDGIVWLNIGDSYASQGGGQVEQTVRGGDSYVNKGQSGASGVGTSRKPSQGYKPKDLIGVPWATAFALRDDGWYLRSGIPWVKGNPMPESTKDRPTANVEYFFLLSKNKKYYYDADATRVPYTEPLNRWGGVKIDTKGKESTWDNNTGQKSYRERDPRPNEAGRLRRVVDFFTDSLKAILNKENGVLLHNEDDLPIAMYCNTKPYKGAHFATFPETLITPMVLAGTSPKACEVCGSPWERVTEHVKGKHNKSASLDQRKRCEGVISGGIETTTIGSGQQGYNITLGWQPTCECEQLGTGKCIILDPFVGSGTTLYVSESLGRDSIGIDLNSEYIDVLVEKRMSGFKNEHKPDPVFNQGSIFDVIKDEKII